MCGCLCILLDTMTDLLSEGALPSDLLRSTSKAGLQYLDATLYSSLETINARRGSSVLLVMYFMKRG